jgi:hypothetical protein
VVVGCKGNGGGVGVVVGGEHALTMRALGSIHCLDLSISSMVVWAIFRARFFASVHCGGCGGSVSALTISVPTLSLCTQTYARWSWLASHTARHKQGWRLCLPYGSGVCGQGA